jgi:Effector-associated domain 11
MTQRQILSERFITLFNKFSENGHLSDREVADVLDISIKTLNHYLEGTHLITILDAYLFCKHFDGDYNYMFQDITNWQIEVSDKLHCGFQSNQPAIGGYSTSYYNDFTPCISINVKKEKRIFEVDGDSMTGGRNNIEDGDILVTQQIGNISDIKEFKLYVIENKDGLCVKELRFYRKDEKIIGFTCVSDLSDLYKPFDIIGNPYTKTYKVIQIIKESVRIKLRKAVGRNKLKEVFKSLIKTLHNNDDLILLESRFNEFRKHICNGIIQNSLDIEMNKIKNSLLIMIDEITEEELSTITLYKL